MVEFTVLCDTDGNVTMHARNGELPYVEELRLLVGARLLEHTKTNLRVDGVPIHAIVDDEGFLKDEPRCNYIATRLCNAVIAGNCALCRIFESIDGEYCLAPLSAEDALALVRYCKYF